MLAAAAEPAARSRASTSSARARSRCCARSPRPGSLREVADALFISRNTIKTHTRALYAKLGVASRDEAVEHGRALGPAEGATMTLADCTVMVVEDHEFQRRTTLQILANLGAGGLLEAADGEGALALLGEADIVVCDLDMPGMDGVEFLRHVSELRAGHGDRHRQRPRRERPALGGGDRARLRPRGARRDPQAADRAPAAPGGRAAPPVGGRAVRSLRSADLEIRLVLALSDGRATAVELRGATLAEAADLVAGRVPAATRSATGDVPAEFDASVGVTLVVATVTEDLLELDPTRVTISLLDGPHLQAAPLALLTRLRVHGFKLGIADFGTGRATLKDLKKLPLTEVQIAARTVQNATGTPHGAEVLAATVEALHHQGVSVVGAGCDARPNGCCCWSSVSSGAQGEYRP